MKYPQVGIVILAAGASRRLGTPKQLVELNGELLIHRVLKQVFKIETLKPLVVLGAHSEKIGKVLTDFPVELAYNENWEDGMGTSLNIGVSHLLSEHKDLQAILLMVTDQVFVTSTVLIKLIETYLTNKPSLVVSSYNDILGVPALFSKELFPMLLKSKGVVGARKLIASLKDQAIAISFPEGEYDVDTSQDLETIRRMIQ